MKIRERENLLLTGAQIVTMNSAGAILRGDLLIENGRITSIGSVEAPGIPALDCRDLIILPGFVQTHVHLCQTLLRGQADDLALLEWLQKRVWPLEAAMDEAAMRASVRLGIAELIKTGTTTLLDMGSVRHYDVVFEELEKSGLRAIGSKCMMDHRDTVPAELLERTQESLRDTEQLGMRWHGRDENRLQAAVCPRFAVSCTDTLLQQAADLAREKGYLLHTHASENSGETQLIRERTGEGNVAFLHDCGFSGGDTVLAHCIWLEDEEVGILTETQTAVAHCPSSNLKLASGIAAVPDYLQRGIRVGLGADGAPCNNNLDMFVEMRLAALIHKLRFGATAMPAAQVIRMATQGGARALGLGRVTGSVEPGKRADLIGIRRNTIHTQPATDVYGQLVYATSSRDVILNIVDGRVLLKNGELTGFDEEEVLARAQEQSRKLLQKALIE